MVARVGVYYAPPSRDALAVAGATWLGRDADDNTPCPQPALTDIAAVTADARRYGFHATLKPPMRLLADRRWDDFLHAAEAMASRIAPFDLPVLAVAELHGFLALRETAPCPALQALADLCVAELDDLRAQPDVAELARRRQSPLTATQDALLARWGYPYVFGEWFFHMTLTRRLSAEERAYWRPAAEDFFADALRVPPRVTEICLFTQAVPGQAFTIAARIPLRG